jgi:hypothetical protein
VRINNLKAAVGRGRGPDRGAEPGLRAFRDGLPIPSRSVPAASGQDKGKVERQVRTDRGAFADLFLARWDTLEALQAALDARSAELHARRRCPVTGTSVAEAFAQERAVLQPMPAVHEPFDCVVARRVSRDCLVSFESRRYSVPFAGAGRTVEVLGTARDVVVYGEGAELARHPLHTAHRLLARRRTTRGRRPLRAWRRCPWGRAPARNSPRTMRRCPRRRASRGPSRPPCAWSRR